MKRYVMLTYFWLSNVLFYLRGKRAYLGLFPPLGSRAVVRARATGNWLTFSMRRKSTDAYSFAEVFLTDCYSPDELTRGAELIGAYHDMAAAGTTPLIIDVGANNGMATAYFADRFPNALVVAVEPHGGNVETIRENAQSDTIEVLEAALVSVSSRVDIADIDADHNAFRVLASDTGAVEGVSVDDLVARYCADGRAEPFLIKIDVEGYEGEVFKRNTDWIDAFALMFIEPHDHMLPGTANSLPLLQALAYRNRDFVLDKHNIISIRNGPATAPARADGQMAQQIVEHASDAPAAPSQVAAISS